MPQEYDKTVKAGLYAGKEIRGIEEHIFSETMDLLNPGALEGEAESALDYLFPLLHSQDRFFANDAVFEVYRKNLELYVVDFPGMSVALVALLNAAYELGVHVDVFHYMDAYGKFMPQEVVRR